MLRRYGADTWFNLGDRDLATHIYRTQRLNQGLSLSQVTNEVCSVLGVKVKILPMSDDKFETRIFSHEGSMHFEEYFVKKQCRDEVLGIELIGESTAKPSPGVLEAILDSEKVVIAQATYS